MAPGPDPTALSPSRRLVAVALLVLVLVAGVTAVDGLEAARLDVTISVEDASCTRPADIPGAWNVTGLTVRVSNHDTVPVEPVFRVPHETWHIQNAWLVQAGPREVSPGETAVYELRVPGRSAWIHNETVGVVRVTNRGTQQRAGTPPLTFSCPSNGTPQL